MCTVNRWLAQRSEPRVRRGKCTLCTQATLRAPYTVCSVLFLSAWMNGARHVHVHDQYRHCLQQLMSHAWALVDLVEVHDHDDCILCEEKPGVQTNPKYSCLILRWNGYKKIVLLNNKEHRSNLDAPNNMASGNSKCCTRIPRTRQVPCYPSPSKERRITVLA